MITSTDTIISDADLLRIAGFVTRPDSPSYTDTVLALRAVANYAIQTVLASQVSDSADIVAAIDRLRNTLLASRLPDDDTKPVAKPVILLSPSISDREAPGDFTYLRRQLIDAGYVVIRAYPDEAALLSPTPNAPTPSELPVATTLGVPAPSLPDLPTLRNACEEGDVWKTIDPGTLPKLKPGLVWKWESTMSAGQHLAYRAVKDLAPIGG